MPDMKNAFCFRGSGGLSHRCRDMTRMLLIDQRRLIVGLTYSGLQYYLSLRGECGGSVVERRTPKRGRGFETDLRRVVSLSKTLYSTKVLVIPRKRWLRPDMTDSLLTVM